MVNPNTEESYLTRPIYKVYKRRFWGLAQLVLLNIVVSWDVCVILHKKESKGSIANLHNNL